MKERIKTGLTIEKRETYSGVINEDSFEIFHLNKLINLTYSKTRILA